jgi:hypothetical protein
MLDDLRQSREGIPGARDQGSAHQTAVPMGQQFRDTMPPAILEQAYDSKRRAPWHCARRIRLRRLIR